METDETGKLDLAVILDTSGSTRNDRFFSIQNFVADMIELLEIGPNKTQVAGLHFSNTTQVVCTWLWGALQAIGPFLLPLPVLGTVCLNTSRPHPLCLFSEDT